MNRANVVSSNIKSIGFETSSTNPQNQDTLEVEFINGSVYQYTGPDIEELYNEMLGAPSTGSFFATRIQHNPKVKHVRVPHK